MALTELRYTSAVTVLRLAVSWISTSTSHELRLWVMVKLVAVPSPKVAAY